MKPDRLWVSAEEVLEVPAARRAKWFKETIGISAAQGEKLNEELKGSAVVLEALAKYAAGGKKGDPSLSKARAGQLVLQPGTERRRTSSHYTPRSLSAPIVRRTLEPLLAVMGDAPPSERILNLKVCDPAMGSGAFLVEACRFLADHVLAAWTREGSIEEIAAEHGDPLLHARRLVAQRCLYGVDKNDAAVELAKLSLWLVTLSKTLPFTFLDHSLRHGDSLVGLDFDQIRNFHWKRSHEKPSKQLDLFGREIAVALEEAIQLRQKIGDLGDSPIDDREKARLFWDAQDALDRVRLIGDLVVGAFFAHERDKDREAERLRREEMVRAWLLTGGGAPEELIAMRREVRAQMATFHWMVEFPEVFYVERPDPLDGDQINHSANMDAFVGNPPFLGGGQVSGTFGDAYRDWLLDLHPGSHGNSDLVAHFFRRAAVLLGRHGTIGMIATNNIAQGDTRETGLEYLVKAGFVIYAADTEMRWGGAADVIVSVVHLASGTVIQCAPKLLDGRRAQKINSRLTEAAEHGTAVRLAANAGVFSLGSKITGAGFVLMAAERDALVQSDPRNSQRVTPYIGGEQVNADPRHEPSRHVIGFGAMTEAEARRWPDLMKIVEERVRPMREAQRDNAIGRTLRRYWWRYWADRPALYAALGLLPRCLVNSGVSKHLAFAFQPTTRTFSHTLYVYPVASYAFFGTLQSRVHEVWARLLSSQFGSSSIGAVLRYNASDCLETFPFPRIDPRAVIRALEDIGRRLYDFRAKYMVDENVGLTITYNRLKDGACNDARILELRALHEEMDRAVVEAYAEGDPEGRWLEIEVPPFCPLTDTDKAKLATFEDAVIDRLFVLNAKRAEEEKIKGLGGPVSKQKTKADRSATTAKAPDAGSDGSPPKKRGPRAKKQPPPEQLAMPSPTEGSEP